MRPKVFAAILLLAGALLVAAALLSKALRPSQPAGDGANISPNRPVLSEAPPPPATGTAPAAPAAAASGSRTNTAAADDPAHALYVNRRIAELNRLAMESDAASRDAILAELRNPDIVIRKAALEAAIQFDDRSVVPRLKEVADATEDPDEKAAILEAIDYINLPSLTEYLDAQKTNAAAGLPANQPARRLHPVRPSTPP